MKRIFVDQLGLHLNSPMPVYHTTWATSAITQDRIRSKEEMQHGSYRVGVGGGDGVSLTGDLRYAELICLTLMARALMVQRQISPLSMLDDFAKCAPRAYSKWESDMRAPVDCDLRNMRSLLELGEQGRWRVQRQMFSDEPDLRSTEYRQGYGIEVDLQSVVAAREMEYNDHPAKRELADVFADMAERAYKYSLALGENEREVANCVLFGGGWGWLIDAPLSVLDDLCVVRTELTPGTIIARPPISLFYQPEWFAKIDTWRDGSAQDLRRSAYGPRSPEPKQVEGLEFDIDVRDIPSISAKDMRRIVTFLPAEDEFRARHPGVTTGPARRVRCAGDIADETERAWGSIFYRRHFDVLTLADNLKAK